MPDSIGSLERFSVCYHSTQQGQLYVKGVLFTKAEHAVRIHMIDNANAIYMCVCQMFFFHLYARSTLGISGSGGLCWQIKAMTHTISSGTHPRLQSQCWLRWQQAGQHSKLMANTKA